MTNVITKVNINPLTKATETITTNMREIFEKGTIEEACGRMLASKLMTTIKDKYNTYLTRSDIAMYEKNISDIQMTVTDTKKGYVVHVSGSDLLYHEYGTGTRGLHDKHPTHDADGMSPYGSGPKVIHRGVRNDGADVPRWYKLYREFPLGKDKKGDDINFNFPEMDFEGETIKSSDFVWISPNRVVTKGLPAGKFIYDSCEEYRDMDAFGSQSTLKHTMTQTVKKKFILEMNEALKKANFRK